MFVNVYLCWNLHVMVTKLRPYPYHAAQQLKHFEELINVTSVSGRKRVWVVQSAHVETSFLPMCVNLLIIVAFDR